MIHQQISLHIMILFLSELSSAGTKFTALINSTQYDLNFFRGFDLVMNALDNKAARNHVNRMCLAADIPLIESGSAGYLGQVTVIKKVDIWCISRV